MSDRTPKLRKKKTPSGNYAVVTLPDGLGGRRDVHLGKHGTRESRAEYARVLAEWETNGRRQPATAADMTVGELIAAYWEHAESYYRKPDGSPSPEIACLRAALRPLRQLYERTPVKNFGPLALEAVRNRMVALGWCRRSINIHVSRIKHLFKWAVAKELVPASTHHALAAVAGLRHGRSEAAERAPVKPVPDAFVDATLPYAPPAVRAMAEIQRLTGMRSGEVCIMRGIDLDTTGKVWLYRPEQHKTAWHGHTRIVAIGPRAQAIVREWLKPNLTAYLFPPSAADKHAASKKKRKPGPHYTPDSYRNALDRAIERLNAARQAEGKAEVPHWHPHQLRHNAATLIRREAGLDAARALLGHHSPQITEVYAEIDVGKAVEVAARLG